MVKDCVVAVIVSAGLGVALCDVPPVPLAVPVTVMVCRPEGTVMFAAVVTVKVTVCEAEPFSVTLAGLKLQSAPAGKPAVQLPGAPVAEFVKLMVWVEPLTGAMVRTAVADCPAGIEAGVKGVL